MKITKTVLGALVVGFLSMASTAGADVCQRVDIKVSNTKNTKIKATSVDYKFKEDGVVRHEAFTDSEVGAGKLKTVAFDQNLTGGEGNTLVSMTLHFQVWCGPSQTSGKWIGNFTHEDKSFDVAVCKSNSNQAYRVDIPNTDLCN